MSSEHMPAHGARNLAARTVIAVVSTIAVAVSLSVSALGLPSGLVGAFQGPLPALGTIEVVPTEPDRVVVCMGPAISFSGQDAAPVAFGEPVDVLAGDQVSQEALVETNLQDAGSLEGGLTPSPPSVLRQPADAGFLAGTSFQRLNNLNTRGLALQECQEPRSETWLVGGDTTTGRQAVLSLSNPGDVAASVNVDVWGASGPISSPLGQGILVGPGAQRVVSLAGLAPNEARPVLRVTSSGTAIAAALHTTIVRGLEADGLSIVTGQAPPGLVRVIPGLFAPPEEIIGPIRGKEGYADVGAQLRVLSPSVATTVTITVVRAALGNITTRLELQAGQVGDLSLDELGSGDFALILDSGEPIVAAVRTSVGNDERTDSSWVGSSYALGGDTLFAVPAIGDTRLSIVNPGDTEVMVALDGRPSAIAAGAMLSRPLGGGSYRLSTEGSVFAVVTARADTILGHLQVLPQRPPQESLILTIR